MPRSGGRNLDLKVWCRHQRHARSPRLGDLHHLTRLRVWDRSRPNIERNECKSNLQISRNSKIVANGTPEALDCRNRNLSQRLSVWGGSGPKIEGPGPNSYVYVYIYIYIQNGFCHKNMWSRTKPFGIWLCMVWGKKKKGLKDHTMTPLTSRSSS